MKRGERWEFVPAYLLDDDDEGGIRRVGSTEDWICSFGDSTRYYPRSGHVRSDKDGERLAAVPLLVDLLEQVSKSYWNLKDGDDYINIAELVKRLRGEDESS